MLYIVIYKYNLNAHAPVHLLAASMAILFVLPEIEKKTNKKKAHIRVKSYNSFKAQRLNFYLCHF